MSGSGLSSTALLVAGSVAVFLGLAALLAFAFLSAADRDPRQSRVRRRLSVYSVSGPGPATREEPVDTSTALGTSGVARSAVELAGRVTSRTDFDTVLATRLEAAGLPLKPPEWALVHLAATVGLGVLLLLVSGGSAVAALVGVAIGAAAPWAFLNYRARKRRSKFLQALPDTLQLLAGSLTAGYSLPQALDAVVRESADPIGSEFNRALVEARLGVPLEDALEGVGVRMGSVDWAWVVMAIRIQREVGGNLAEILSTVAATLRERERLRRQVEVLSAEGRLSAWILGLLPALFVVYLLLVRPSYLRLLYTSAFGWAMIIVAALLYIGGIFWLRRVVRVEV